MLDNQSPEIPAQGMSDNSLTDQFPTEGVVGSQPTTAQEGQPEVQPQAPSPQAWEFRTNTGTVYNSREDAIRGVEHKDLTIQHLRQEFIQRNGYDPLSQNQPQQQFQQPSQQPQAEGYAANPKQYAVDLQQAAAYGQQTGDYSRYYQVQQQAIDERAAAQIQQYLGPYEGLIQNLMKSQALESASTSVPGFRTFYGSQDYNSVLHQQPLLADAIRQAEVNPQFADKLPGLYSLVHQLSQASKVAEQVRQAQPPANSSPVPTRPTASPSTMTPPANSSVPSSGESWRGDKEVRRNLIAQMEAKYGIRSR